MSDQSTEEGAKRLAGIIERYWLDRGWWVTTRVEYSPGTNHQNGGTWRINSDTINGMPTKRIVDVAA